MNYFKIKEYNDSEGETWIHFIKVEGNEKSIEKLKRLIDEYGGGECGEDYTYEEEYKSESIVDILMEEGGDDYGYMNKYAKVDGDIPLSAFDGIKDEDSFDDKFYKGRIRDLGDE